MSDMLLRIILASYLAIWSPAMCCCGVKAVMGAVTSIETGDCHGMAAASVQFQIDSYDAPMGACCAHRNVDVAEADPFDAVCDASQSTSEAPAPCRCHQAIESKVRLDTGAKIAAPALAHVSTLPSFTPLMTMFIGSPFVAVTPCGEGGSGGPSGRGWRDCGPPARSTLLAQRTLLLI